MCANKVSAQHTKRILLFLQKRAGRFSAQKAQQSALCYNSVVRTQQTPQHAAAMQTILKYLQEQRTNTFFCV